MQRHDAFHISLECSSTLEQSFLAVVEIPQRPRCRVQFKPRRLPSVLHPLDLRLQDRVQQRQLASKSKRIERRRGFLSRF
jgi:hypothetical protein